MLLLLILWILQLYIIFSDCIKLAKHGGGFFSSQSIFNFEENRIERKRK